MASTCTYCVGARLALVQRASSYSTSSSSSVLNNVNSSPSFAGNNGYSTSAGAQHAVSLNTSSPRGPLAPVTSFDSAAAMNHNSFRSLSSISHYSASAAIEENLGVMNASSLAASLLAFAAGGALLAGTVGAANQTQLKGGGGGGGGHGPGGGPSDSSPFASLASRDHRDNENASEKSLVITDNSVATATSPIATTATSQLVNAGAMGLENIISAFSPSEEKMEDSGYKNTTESSAHDVSAWALKGARIFMEDEYYVAEGGRFVGVFDGHGGSAVSTYLRDKLYDRVHNNLKKSNEISAASLQSTAAALRQAICDVDRAVMLEDSLEYQGSTAVTVMVHEDEKKRRTIIAGNVGDSRAVLCRNGEAVDLTRDHKPYDHTEKKRILSMGEKIDWDADSGIYRVCDLSLSRAIGDRFAKPVVHGEPEIKFFPIKEESDDFVLLASDGLWDVMTSQEVVGFVKRKMDAPTPLNYNSEVVSRMRRKNMSRYVANEALRRGTLDNVCVVLLWLNDVEDLKEATSSDGEKQ